MNAGAAFASAAGASAFFASSAFPSSPFFSSGAGTTVGASSAAFDGPSTS